MESVRKLALFYYAHRGRNMKDEIKRFRERRDARLKSRRADEDWITMNGTHVLIDDDGQVSKGPETLKSVVKSGGGYKSKSERKYGSNAKYAKALSNGWNQRNQPSAGKYVNYMEEHGFKKEEPKKVYKSIPMSFRVGGGKYATPEEKKERKEIINSFINEAKEGDVYRSGSGVGSSGGEFEILKGKNGLMIGWKNSRYRPVEMSRSNVEKFISSGATLIKRK